jgi:UDP-glucuronate 4-epimerase
MRIFITGIAGFIGMHTALRLKELGHSVYGIDNFNEFYYSDGALKNDRAKLLKIAGILVAPGDITLPSTFSVLDENNSVPDVVIHLAAHAGVRHSFDNAARYIENNILGTQHLIDACKHRGVTKVLYASTSCVAAGQDLPWEEEERTYMQLNPYGYTKRTNECQFSISGIPQTIGMRFFTVYGPYGRPDMALFKFANAAVKNEPVDIYNYGDMKRDFTFVDDIVEGIVTLLKADIKEQNSIFNIGRGKQVNLMDFVSEIEKNFGVELEKTYLPKHPADTKETFSNTTKLKKLGWEPSISIPEGVRRFTNWYKKYYGV